MRRKNIIVAIIVVIGLITFIATASSSKEQVLSEKRLGTVISSFIARDYIWDESHNEICYPQYIEISALEDSEFFIMVPLSENYKMFYSTVLSEPNFFIETPYSEKNTIHSAHILSICKRLQYGTCFLKISDSDTVIVDKIRINRDGILEALDTSGNWHEKIPLDNFILG